MAQPYYTTSKITGKTYNVFDTVIIMNPRQAAYYCHEGLELQDLEISDDRKTGEPVFCYIFLRSESRPYFDAWCKKKQE